MTLPIPPIGSNPAAAPQAPGVRARAQGSPTPPPVDPTGGGRARSSADVAESLGERTQRIVDGDRTVEFSFNDDVDRVVIKVKSGNDEVVRQIPPEEYVNFLAKFREMLGVLFDERV